MAKSEVALSLLIPPNKRNILLSGDFGYVLLIELAPQGKIVGDPLSTTATANGLFTHNGRSQSHNEGFLQQFPLANV